MLFACHCEGSFDSLDKLICVTKRCSRLRENCTVAAVISNSVLTVFCCDQSRIGQNGISLYRLNRNEETPASVMVMYSIYKTNYESRSNFFSLFDSFSF